MWCMGLGCCDAGCGWGEFFWGGKPVCSHIGWGLPGRRLQQLQIPGVCECVTDSLGVNGQRSLLPLCLLVLGWPVRVHVKVVARSSP